MNKPQSCKVACLACARVSPIVNGAYTLTHTTNYHMLCRVSIAHSICSSTPLYSLEEHSLLPVKPRILCVYQLTATYVLVVLWQVGSAPVCPNLLPSTDVQCKAHTHTPPVASGMGAFPSTQQAPYVALWTL